MRLLKLTYLFLVGTLNMIKFLFNDIKKIKNSNIVFFLPFYHTGGAEKVHLNIVKALNNHKCCVIFTQSSATNNFKSDFENHAAIIEINSIRNKKSKFLNRLLQKLIIKNINKSIRINAVFGCNTSYYYELLPKLKHNLKKVDLIHAIFEDTEIENRLIKSSQFISQRVCINNKAKNDLAWLYKTHHLNNDLLKKIVVIENGVNIKTANFFDLNQVNKLKFGFIGRWSEEKRPKVFLEVAKQIKAKFPQVEFVMAGTGMKSNIDLINNAGVTFLGEITNEADLNSMYASLTGVIISSVYEGFPMVIMESMIFGVVPISTNVGGINRHIQHKHNGLLINSKEYDNLVKDFFTEINYLIENDLELKQMSFIAKEYAIANFSIEKFNNSYQQLFKLQT